MTGANWFLNIQSWRNEGMPPKEPGARSWHWCAYYSSPGSSPASQTCSTQGATSSGLWKAWAAEELGALRRPPEILYSIRNRLSIFYWPLKDHAGMYSVFVTEMQIKYRVLSQKNPKRKQLKMTPSVKWWLPRGHAHTNNKWTCSTVFPSC